MPRLLIVDDSQDSRELLYWRLGGPSTRFALDMAVSGEEAAELLDTCHYDLVITDQYMPGLSGVVLIKHILTSSRHRGTGAILMSSDDDPALARIALAAGASAVMVKPFNPEELMDLVDRVLEAQTGPLTLKALPTIQAFLDAIPFLAMVLDSDHQVVAGNAAFYETTGRARGECPIRCSTAVHGEAGEPRNCPLTESARTGRAARQLVVDRHLGSLDVDVFPLHTASDDGRELFLHMARPIG